MELAVQSKETAQRVASARAPRGAFLAVSALLSAASSLVTVVWCASMGSMGDMAMPGGWSMSMAWMRMPGQTWLGAASEFIGMWSVMMVAMMLPCAVPMLLRYRAALFGAGARRLGRLSAIAGAGYFTLWTALGVVAYPIGIALAEIEMRYDGIARVVPLAAGVVVIGVGCVQLSAWKTRRLSSCRGAGCGREAELPTNARGAWSRGLRLGIECALCCGNLMVLLLVLGVMDLGAMAVVTAVTALERLAPAGERVARAIGIVVVAAGLAMIAHAFGNA